MRAALDARPAEAQKLEWLRLQIEMRVLGLGWSASTRLAGRPRPGKVWFLPKMRVVFAHAVHFLHSHASPALQLHYNCIR